MTSFNFLCYIASYDDLIKYVLENKFDKNEMKIFAENHYNNIGINENRNSNLFNPYVCAFGYPLLCDDHWNFEKNCLNEDLFTYNWILYGYKNNINKNLHNVSFDYAFQSLKNKKKVVLLFWGLSRSLIHTHDSLYKNVIKPLHNLNFIVCRCFHTYYLEILTNSRSQEFNVSLNNNEWKLLKPHFFKIDDQNETIKKLKLNIEDLNHLKDPWYDKRKSLQNTFLAMYSQSQSFKLINHIDFDFYIYIRPDIKFRTPLLESFFTLNSDIKIPNWGHFGGFNDRFSICNKHSASLYQRFDFALKETHLHSEQLLKKRLTMNKLHISFIDFKFIRVRSNGINVKEEFR